MGMVSIGVQSAPLYPQLIALATRQCGVDGVGGREAGEGAHDRAGRNDLARAFRLLWRLQAPSRLSLSQSPLNYKGITNSHCNSQCLFNRAISAITRCNILFVRYPEILPVLYRRNSLKTLVVFVVKTFD